MENENEKKVMRFETDVIEDVELISIAQKIRPLPGNIRPSMTFVETMRAQLLQLGRGRGRGSVANAA